MYCSAYKIFTVFSIYTSLQAGHYHVKKMTHFNTAAVWLELGLAVSLRLGIIQFCDNNVSDQLDMQCNFMCWFLSSTVFKDFPSFRQNKSMTSKYLLCSFLNQGQKIHARYPFLGGGTYQPPVLSVLYLQVGY